MSNEMPIFEQVREIFVSSFDVDPEHVVLSANIFEDLDLDSIDAVDLAVKLQELTGQRVKPDEFKLVKTVADVVSQAEQLFAQASA
jgi:acyl carrier protein